MSEGVNTPVDKVCETCAQVIKDAVYFTFPRRKWVSFGTSGHTTIFKCTRCYYVETKRQREGK